MEQTLYHAGTIGSQTLDAEQLREAELIGRAQAGDREALSAALLAQQAACFGFALRLTKNLADAEDVCQDAFVRAARDIKAWRPTGSFRSWLLRMVLCAHQNWRAADSARRQRERRYAMAQETTGATAENTIEHLELKKHLEGALTSLGETYRLPLVLHYEQGLSRSEVAAVLEVPEGTVATHIRRGVERLRELLMQAGYECPAPAVIAALGAAASTPVPVGLSTVIHGIAAGAGKGSAAAGTTGLAALAKFKLAALLAAAVLTAGAAALMTQRFSAAPQPAPGAETKDDVKPEAPLPFPPSSISGVVVDATTNKPLAGIQVLLRIDSHEKIMPIPGAPQQNGTPVAVTDEKGNYTLRFMTDARTCLSQTLVYVQNDKFMNSSVYAAVYQGEAVTVSPIKLTAYQTVRGRVVDPDGKPVAGAFLRCFGISEMTTDNDGYFTDSHVLPHSSSWDVVADGFELKRFPFWIGDPKAGSPVIQLVRCKSVTGIVKAGENNPLTDVVVYAGGYPSVSMFPNWVVPIDKDGRFSVGSSQEKGGPMYIFAVRNKDIVGEPAKVEPGQTGVSLQLYSVGKVVVDVKDPDDKPMANIHLRVIRNDLNTVRWGATDADGRATLLDVPAGPGKVEILSVDGPRGKSIKLPESVSVQIDAGKTATATLKCTLASATGPVITGYLLNDHGQPVLHASLQACLLKENGNKQEVYRGVTMTEVDGRFEMILAYDNGMRDGKRRDELESPEKPGQVRIAATLAGFGGFILNEVKDWPATGNSLDLKNFKINIAPERIVVVKGERPGKTKCIPLVLGCVDSKGKAVVYKNLSEYGAEPRISVRCDGPLTIKVDDTLGHQLDLPVSADAKNEAAVVAQFPAARQVEITILDSAGKPVDQVSFHAHPEANSKWPFPTKWSDKTGKLSFELASEAAAKFVLFDGLKHQPYFGEITPGDKPLVETIRLKDPDATVSGRITTQAGKAPPPVRGHLEVSVGRWLSTGYEISIDAEGNFNLPVPSGLTVTVTASAETKELALEARTEPVTLTPGQRATMDAPLDKQSDKPWERKSTVKPKPTKPVQPSKDDF